MQEKASFTLLSGYKAKTFDWVTFKKLNKIKIKIIYVLQMKGGESKYMDFVYPTDLYFILPRSADEMLIN